MFFAIKSCKFFNVFSKLDFTCFFKIEIVTILNQLLLIFIISTYIILTSCILKTVKKTSIELYPILGPLSQEGGMAKLAWPSAGNERVQ